MNTPTGHLAATDPADTPFRQDTTPGLGLVGALLGVAFVVANGMLALGVQHFLYWTGGLAAVCFIPMIFCNLTGGTRRSRFWFDLLLTLTFFNFNMWAFSYLGSLMAYLGLFFFALFSLNLGAAVFRLLRDHRPLRQSVVVGFAALLTLGTWIGGLALEAAYLPDYAAKTFLDKTGIMPPNYTRPQLLSLAHEATREKLDLLGGENLIGYVYWVLSDSRIEMNVPDRAKTITFSSPQGCIGTAVRLVLSLVMTGLGIFSQLLPLTRLAPRSDETTTDTPKP